MVSQRVPEYKNLLLQNKFYFAEKHIEFLSSYPNNDLEKIIFLVNQRPEDDVNEIQSFFDLKAKELKEKFDFTLTFRENKNISYGAWNDAICTDLQTTGKSEYYFCLEDDYIPSKNNFIYPFIEKCNEKTPYVCCKAVYDNHSVGAYASVSNGLFLKSACENVYKKNQSVFSLTNKDEYSYSDACSIQETFYRLFLEMGYDIIDIFDRYFIPFFESDTGRIKKIGNENNPTLIEPILL